MAHKGICMLTFTIVMHNTCIDIVCGSLLGFWPFSETTKGLDVSGNGNHGTLFNVDIAEGPYTEGTSLALNTAGSYIRIPNNDKLVVPLSFTILMAVKATGTSDGPIFDFNVPDWGVHIWILHPQAADIYVRPMEIDGTVLSSVVHATSLENAWVFLGIIYDKAIGQMSIWVNGTEAFSDTVISTELGTTGDVFIGATDGYGDFRGRVSCYQLYDTVLSAAEITNNGRRCEIEGLNKAVSPAPFRGQAVSPVHCLNKVYVRSAIECMKACNLDNECHYFNIRRENGGIACEFTDIEFGSALQTVDYSASPSVNIYERIWGFR